MRVIDVSEHNGTINWESVKAAGIQGAIIRCGYGMDMTSQDDKQWSRNVSECERLGILYGVYLYSYADNADKARSEAQHVLRLIKGRKLSFPVYYDLEQAGIEGAAVANAKIQDTAQITARCRHSTSPGSVRTCGSIPVLEK